MGGQAGWSTAGGAFTEQIIREMQKDPAWERVRSDFRGAVLLARSSPEAAKQLRRFVEALTERPAWLNAQVRNEAWMA